MDLVQDGSGDARYEVKGIWFVSARDYVAQELGGAALDAFIAAMPERHRDTLTDALHSSWYPEDALADMLATIHEHLARGSDDAALDLLRNMSTFGVGRFFKLLLSLSSAGFAMRNVPTLWARMRRGPAQVAVRIEPNAASVQTRTFPYVARPAYPIMIRATLEAVCHATGATGARAVLDECGPDWADFRVTW